MYYLILFFLLSSCAHYYNFYDYSEPAHSLYDHHPILKVDNLTVYADKNLREDYKRAIVNSADSWNHLLNKNVFKIEFVDNIYKYATRIDFVSYWTRRDSLAITVSSYQGSIIFSREILVNVEKYNFTTDGSCSLAGSYDLQSVLTHELGHMIGLGESNNVNAVMGEKLSACRIRRNLTSVDYQMYLALYNG